MDSPRQRGFTLLELMITMAITSVVIAAAVSVFVTLASQQRAAERLVEAQSSTMVALASMQMDVSNAGYRFPLPAFAVRHIEVDSATSLPSVGNTTITSTSNCDTAGLVEGTDVLELAEGWSLVGPGKAMAAVVTGGASVTFTLGNRGEPFTTTEAIGGAGAPAVNSVLVFADAVGSSCLVRVTSLDNLGMTVGTGTLLDRDYQPLASGAFYPGCPAADMAVYRLGQRTRYMVCKPTTPTTPNVHSLYRQTAGMTGMWAAPVRLEEGIEDLQVSMGYSNADGGIASTGTTPTCLQVGGSASSYCYCDDQPSGACGLSGADIEPGLTSLTGTSRVSLVRGIRVQLTGMGQRMAVVGAPNPAYRRPDSFDHAGMNVAAADNFLRVQQQFSYAFQNLQVVP